MLYCYATLIFDVMRTCLPILLLSLLLDSFQDDFYFTFSLHFVAVDNNGNFRNFIQVITSNDHCEVFIFIIVGYLWLFHSCRWLSLSHLSLSLSLAPSTFLCLVLSFFFVSPSLLIISCLFSTYLPCAIFATNALLYKVRTANVIKEISRAVIR